jgi:hypothetical protein
MSGKMKKNNRRVERLEGNASVRPLTARRCCVLYNTYTASTGVVTAVYASSGSVVSCADFSSMAVLFQEYRVRGIRIRFMPRFNNALGVAASQLPTFAASSFVGATTPGSLTASLTSQSLKLHRASDVIEVTCDHRQNPSADLWSSTSGAPTTLSLIGVGLQSVVAAPSNMSALTWDVFYFYDVEFRTAL